MMHYWLNILTYLVDHNINNLNSINNINNVKILNEIENNNSDDDTIKEIMQITTSHNPLLKTVTIDDKRSHLKSSSKKKIKKRKKPKSKSQRKISFKKRSPCFMWGLFWLL